MRATFFVLLVAVALIVPVGLVTAGSHEDRNDSDENRGNDNARAMDGQRGKPAWAGKPGGIGEDGTFSGRHITFAPNASMPGLRDYHLVGPNVTLLDSVTLPFDGEEDEVDERAAGATYRMETEAGRLQAHDNPVAILLIEGDEGHPATLVLAPGVSVAAVNATGDDEDDDDADENETERQVYLLRFGDNLTAYLSGKNITYDNSSTFSIEDKALLRLGAPAIDRPDRDDEDDEPAEAFGREGRGKALKLGKANQERVNQALANGAFAVEVFADADEGEPVVFEIGHVRVTNAQVAKDGPLKASLEIEADDDSPGAVVVLNLDAEDLGNLTVTEAAENLVVEFDGEQMTPADDLADIMRWDDDGETAEYLLLVGAKRVQVLVSIPHFSPHTVAVYHVQASEEETASETPLSPLVALAAVAIAATVIARRQW